MRTMFGRAHSSRVKPLGVMQAVIDRIYRRRIKNDVKTQRQKMKDENGQKNGNQVQGHVKSSLFSMSLMDDRT
jgi:hypothetical protein